MQEDCCQRVISTVAKKIFAFRCQCYCMKWGLKGWQLRKDINFFLHKNICVCLPVDLSIINNFLGTQASNISKVQTSDASFKFGKTWIVHAIYKIYTYFFLLAKFIHFFYICHRKRNHKKFEMFFSSLLTMKFKCLRIGILPLHFLSSIHLS